MISVDHIYNLDRRITNEGAAFDSVAGSNAVPMQLWVPSERVGVHLIDVPTAPERKWPELIPWLLEDRLLQPVADMHFVIAGRSHNGQLQIWAVSHNDMREWQRVADNAGVAVQSLVPDYLALPWEEGRIHIAWRDGCCLVRTGVDQGFAANADIAWTMIDNLLATAEIAPRLSIAVPDPTLVPEHVRQLADINDASIDWTFADNPVTANLLSGQYRASTRSLPTSQWLPAAGLGVLALVLMLSYLQLSSSFLQTQVQSLEKQLVRDYSKLFPGARQGTRGIREAVEARLNASFLQQRALTNGSVATLTALDELMSTCDCDLIGLVAEKDSLELTIGNGERLKTRALNIPDYQVAITQQSMDDKDPTKAVLVLMISPDQVGRL